MSERTDRTYLDDMLDSIGAIEQYVSGLDYNHFIEDRKTYSATLRGLKIIGEAAGKDTGDY